MSGREDHDKLVKEVTNEMLTDKFIQELGTKARVERTTLGDEYGQHMDQLRDVIKDVAGNLQEIGVVPKGMEYRGSLSIHIFSSELLKTTAFVDLNVYEKLNFALADAAMRELNGKLKEIQGQRRTKLRSGF